MGLGPDGGVAQVIPMGEPKSMAQSGSQADRAEQMIKPGARGRPGWESI